MPVSAQPFSFMRTYTCEAGSSPTRMTASPGGLPCLAASSAACSLISALMAAEVALPSRSIIVVS